MRCVRSAARLGGLLGDAALGGQLAFELRAAHGGLTLLGRFATLLHQPCGLALGLLGLGVGALGLTTVALGLVARGVGGGDGLRCGLDALARLVLGLDVLL